MSKKTEEYLRYAESLHQTHLSSQTNPPASAVSHTPCHTPSLCHIPRPFPPRHRWL